MSARLPLVAEPVAVGVVPVHSLHLLQVDCNNGWVAFSVA
jgi:hypothetical protein